MKFIYLANGWLGLEILRWLMKRGDQPLGLVVHPQERQRNRSEICEISELTNDRIIEGSFLKTPEGVAWVNDCRPDLLVSVLFGYILKSNILSIPKLGAINIHPGYLPYHRGRFPNDWSIIEGTPAGTTMHFMDTGIDTGDIIAQREVPVTSVDTGISLYERLMDASLSLFQETWPKVVNGPIPRTPQALEGSYHCFADFEKIHSIDPQKMMKAEDLINLLRARTFPPYQGAYLEYPNKRVYIRVELSEEMKDPSSNDNC